ncbi:hypothetical protein P3X46_033855 [Hevea brasiliensis]|uniref:Uncharacterized protein n=1 Tax=Hevea brasiliensis TaxID=3981 RepID=A0ABQ9KBJ5_HEVBR|nr:hypothetical protein P3X46_033855 [Hevea brasiliensis]
MLRLNRLIKHINNSTKSSLLLLQKQQQQEKLLYFPFSVADEMNRGYFADIAEFKQHGGRIAVANKVIIPAMAVVKFPNLEVNFSDGKTLKFAFWAVIDSWTMPFLDAFHDAKNIHLKSSTEGNNALQKWIVYSFGDHYYFRKELKILNLLTVYKSYIFLLDKFGRITWQGFGLATQEELSSLLSCTSFLLEEK